MKRLAFFWSTPASILIAISATMLAVEFLIMLLIEGIRSSNLKDVVLERMAVEFIDPILLILLVSPALYLLIFKPMRNQQVELAQQNDELRRKEKLGALIEAIPDAVFLKDSEGRWLFTNEPAKQMFQLHNLPWQGKTEMELADLHPAFRSAHAGCLASDEEAWQAGYLLVGEESVVGEDGRCAIIETRKVPLFSKEGRRKGLVVIGRDITERKCLENELKESRQLLRELAEKAEISREEERKHIAREVHDELGQILTALRMDVALINLRFGEQNAALLEKTQSMTVLLDQAGQCVRYIVSNLRPSALDMGIVSAVGWLCNEFAARTGCSCVLHTIEEHVDLDEARAVAVFRIVQELLTNAARHAGASSVEITLTQHVDYLHVQVHDNGKGFEPAAAEKKNKTFGLLGIRERVIALGGEVELVSAPSQGTLVTIIVPTRTMETTNDSPVDCR